MTNKLHIPSVEASKTKLAIQISARERESFN
jgi:hypothetical protein